MTLFDLSDYDSRDRSFEPSIEVGPVQLAASSSQTSSAPAIPSEPTSPASSSVPSAFQSSSTKQGQQFATQCDTLLENLGFELGDHFVVDEVGIEIDRAATSPAGNTVWFEYKGSIQGKRPGLIRTDTMKKAVANGALLAGLLERKMFVVLTSHLPEAGSGLAMLRTAVDLGYLDDVICIYDPRQTERLRKL